MESQEYLLLGADAEQPNADEDDSDEEQVWIEEIRKLKGASSKLDAPGTSEEINLEDDTESTSILRIISTGLGGAAPTPRNVIILNNVLTCILKKMEQQITQKLLANQEKQEELTRALRDSPPDLHTPLTASIMNCGMPYFKTTIRWISQPENVFTRQHRLLNYATPEMHVKPTYCWSWNDYKRLFNAVVDAGRDAEIKNIDSEFKMAKKSRSKAELVELKKRLDALRNGAMPKQLGENVNWVSVSIKVGLRSARECQAAWMYSVDPKINKKKWHIEEKMKLVSTARRNRYENWEKIAREVGTGRSALQCCVTYQRLPSGDGWTEEEDVKAKAVIASLQDVNRFWTKFSYFFPEKYPLRGKHRARLLSEPPKASKSTRLIAFCRNDNSSLKKMLRLFLCQDTYKQLETDALRVLRSKSGFSDREDKLLLTSVKDCGSDLSALVGLFPDREPLQVVERYAQLSQLSNEILSALTEKVPSQLMPRIEDPTDIWPILQLFWSPDDHSNRKKKRCGVDISKSIPVQQLVRILQFSHRNVFGPRFYRPQDDAQKHNFALRMTVVCDNLYADFVPKDVAERVRSDDEEFHYPPHQVLANIKDTPPPEVSKILGQRFIPPNQLTLLGARILSSARGLLTGQAALPLPLAVTEMDDGIEKEERLLPGEARELLKKRMESLFFLSLCLSKLNCKETPIAEPKLPKRPKQARVMSKLKRKNRASHLNSLRWKKVKKEETGEAPSMAEEAADLSLAEEAVDDPSSAEVVEDDPSLNDGDLQPLDS